MAGPSNRELSRYQKEIIGVVACSILVIFVLTPFTAKVLGPLSLVVVLAASLAPYLWRYRKLLYDYAHQELTLSEFIGSPSTSFVRRTQQLEDLGFELHPLSVLRLNSRLMDSKPLALFNSPDSLIAATVLRKRLGFATELEDGRWLVTANRPMINHRQVVRVVVKQSDAAAVLHEHKRTLARLTDEHGISPVAPTSDDVTVLNRLEQERLRQHFADGDGMLALFGLFKVGPEGDPLVEVVDQEPLAG